MTNQEITVTEITVTEITVTEISTGFQYNAMLGGRAVMARIGLEGQLWKQPPVIAGLLDDNVGLFGPTFSLSARF